MVIRSELISVAGVGVESLIEMHVGYEVVQRVKFDVRATR